MTIQDVIFNKVKVTLTNVNKYRGVFIETAARRCSSEYLFLKMSIFTEKHLGWSLFLIKLQA